MSPAPASSSPAATALSLKIVAECGTTKARAAVMRAVHPAPEALGRLLAAGDVVLGQADGRDHGRRLYLCLYP